MSSFSGPLPLSLTPEEGLKRAASAYSPATEWPQKALKVVSPGLKAPAAGPVEASPPSPSMGEYPDLPLPSEAIETPTVSFGEDVPHPRWVFVEASVDPRLTQNATKTMQSPTMKGVRVIDFGTGMGTLAWRFEAGTQEGWNGLTFDQLYLYAYKVLFDVLNDAILRDYLRKLIRNGRLASKVSMVEDPLPPLPRAPDNYVPEPPGPFKIPFDYTSHSRPSLARWLGDNTEGPHPALLTKMRKFTWGENIGPDPVFPASSRIFSQGIQSSQRSGSSLASESMLAAGSPVLESERVEEAPNTGEFSYFHFSSHRMMQFEINKLISSAAGEAAQNGPSNRESGQLPGGSPKIPQALHQSQISSAPQTLGIANGHLGGGPAGKTLQQEIGKQLSKERPSGAKGAVGKSRGRVSKSPNVPLRRNPPRRAKKVSY